MSKVVDQRVVEMQFDNKQFEQNVASTMSTLEKLKSKLSFSGSTKGLEDIGKAARNVNMNGLTAGIDTVNAKFTAMQVAGMTAISRITNSAITSGKRIANALTIEPVTTGFREYELKMDSVKTIMASTGESVDTVNKYLEELNEYSDQTIYSFSDMTQNIGKFTNAGVKLEDAVMAIKGISNEAAVSGANANEASRAMYNFAQALSAGYVKLVDWKSIELANMATVEFKQQLIDAAVAAGTLTKSADGMYTTLAGNSLSATKNFNETLQDQWMTTEVLVNTLKDYADETTEIGKKAFAAAQDVTKLSQMFDVLKETAQSGWARTWEILFGDIEKAKAVFTPMTQFFSGIIDSISDFRNNLLEGALGSPFMSLAEKVSTMSDSIGNTVESLRDYNAVVDQILNGDFGTGQFRWDKLTEAGYDWAHAQNLVNERLGDGTRHATTYTEAQKEVSKAREQSLDSLAKLSDAQLKELGYTEEQVSALRELSDAAKKAGLPISEFLDKVKETDGRTLLIDSLKNAAQGLVAVFTAVKNAWVEIFPPMTSLQLYGIISAINDLSKHLIVSGETADELKRTFKGLFALIDIVTTIFSGGFKIAFKIAKQILGMFNMDILDVTASVGDAIVSFRDWIDETLDVTKLFEVLSPYITSFVETVRDMFAAFKQSAFAKKFVSIVDKLVSAFKKLKNVKIEKIDLGEFMKRIREGLGLHIPEEMKEIGRNIVDALQNGIGDGLYEIVSKAREIATTIINTVKEVLGIHSPSTVFIEIGKNIIQGLVEGIASGIRFVVEGAAAIGKYITDMVKQYDVTPAVDKIKAGYEKLKEVFSGFDWSKMLAIIPIAVVLVAIKEIYDLAKALGDGITGVNDVIENFADIEKSVKKYIDAKAFENMATVLEKVAKAIAVLVGAIWVLSTIDDPEQLYTSVAIIVILSLVLSSLAKAMAKMQSASAKIGKDGIKVAGIKTGLITLTAALLLMAATVKVVGEMDPNQAKQGFIGLAGLLVAMVGVMALLMKICVLSPGHEIAKVGGLMISMAVTMALLIGVSKLVAQLSPDEMYKGSMFALAFLGFIAILTMSTTILGTQQTAKLSGLLLSISVSMMLMIGVCKLANTLTPDEMWKGAAFALAFVNFITMLRIATTIGGGDQIAKIAGLVLSISVSMILLVGMCKLVGKLDASEMAKGALFLAGFIAFVWALVKVTTIGGEQKIAKVAAILITMSVAVGILAGLAVLIGMVPTEMLEKGVTAIVLLGTVMTAMIWATRGAEKCVGNIIAMSVAIGIMTACVAALTFVDTDKLMTASLALMALMGTFAILLNQTDNMGKVTGTLIAMALAVGILGGMLYLVGTLPVAQSLGAALSLTIVMAALVGVMWVISSLTAPSTQSLVALGVVTLVVAALGGVLYLLRENDPTQSLGMVLAVSAFLVALIAALEIMTLMSAPSFIALGALAIVTLVVAALAVILYQLREVDPNQALGMVVAISIFLAAMMLVCLAASALGAVAAPAAIGLGVLLVFIGALGLVLIGLADLAMDVLAGLPKLGQDLSDFMTNVQGFIDGVENIPDDISDKIGKLSKAILQLTGAEFLNNIADFFSGGNVIAELGSELKSFGDDIASFTKNAGNIDTAVESLKKIKDITSAIEGIDLSSLTELSGALKTHSTTVITAVLDSIKSRSVQFKDAGVNLMAALIAGIVSERSKVATAAKQVSVLAATAIRSSYQSFYSSGSYLVSGFAAGISANSYKAEAKAAAMASAAAKAAKEELDINSPSKVFTAIGTSIPEGFAVGIDKMRRVVISSAVDMANAPLDSVREAIAGISEAINSDMDAQPTIRPVLDLSNVRTGAAAIGGMFRSPIGTLATAGSINMMMNGRNQNGANGDVVSAIDKLNKKLDNVGNTYNSINGISYDDDTSVTDAIKTIVRAAKIERRV